MPPKKTTQHRPMPANPAAAKPRSQWPQPPPAPGQLPDVCEFQHALANGGYWHSAAAAIRRHRHVSQIRNNREELVWKQYVKIQATLDKLFLSCTMVGNIQREKEKGTTAVVEQLDYLSGLSDIAPGIYLLELVHSVTKKAPSYKVLQKILQIATDYVELRDHDAAFRIDQHFNKDWQKADSYSGMRAYMKNPQVHVPKFYQLKDAMEKIFAACPASDMDRTPRMAMREVGYGQQAKGRIKDHKKHRNSNFLMNLFEAICVEYEQELGGEYRIFGEVIYVMWAEEQCMLAEEFFTAVCQADTVTGRGFCHADAGDTASRAYTKFRDKWSAVQQKVLKDSPYTENMEQELKRISGAKADNDALDWLEWQIQQMEDIPVPEADESDSPGEKESLIAELLALEAEQKELRELNTGLGELASVLAQIEATNAEEESDEEDFNWGDPEDLQDNEKEEAEEPALVTSARFEGMYDLLRTLDAAREVQPSQNFLAGIFDYIDD